MAIRRPGRSANHVGAADAPFEKVDPQWGIELRSTPFRPMPATPTACWPMSPVNYRDRIAKVLRQGLHDQYKRVFFRGNRFWSAESHGTESLPTVILDALVMRGTDNDSEVIARLASSGKFRSASMKYRTAILERYVDIDRLFGAYTWENLPTRYLVSHTPTEKLRKADDVARKRAGKPWPLAVSKVEPEAVAV